MTAGAPCACGYNAVAACTQCGRPVCGQHLERDNETSKVLCEQCAADYRRVWQAHEAATGEARGRVIAEFLKRAADVFSAQGTAPQEVKLDRRGSSVGWQVSDVTETSYDYEAKTPSGKSRKRTMLLTNGDIATQTWQSEVVREGGWLRSERRREYWSDALVWEAPFPWPPPSTLESHPYVRAVQEKLGAAAPKIGVDPERTMERPVLK
jgi:hypothetical protein